MYKGEAVIRIPFVTAVGTLVIGNAEYTIPRESRFGCSK